MSHRPRLSPRRSSLRWLLLLVLACFAHGLFAATAQSDVAALRAKYTLLQWQLKQNQFKRPLVIQSSEAQDTVFGDVYAVIDFPFNTVRSGLASPGHWCDVMILHINTKYCQAVEGPTGAVLRVNVGKKTPEELASTTRIDFDYRVVNTSAEYLRVALTAKEGSLGTSDYRITLETMPLPSAQTFLHLTYSYATNIAGKLALQTYLGTVGRDKVGFTVVPGQAAGPPVYIGGVRGVVERNTMRYYLAINAFLESEKAPEGQVEKRLQNWFTAVERYPQQLHEMDRSTYLEMKRAEILRQTPR